MSCVTVTVPTTHRDEDVLHVGAPARTLSAQYSVLSGTVSAIEQRETMSEINLESLVNALVPLAKSDESLRNELVAHCGEVLKRFRNSYMLRVLRAY